MTATPDTQQDFVPAAGVPGLTRAYDLVIATTMRENKLRAGVFAAVAKAIAGLEQPSIVELGCGTGSIAIPLAAQSPQASVTAIDIDPQALAIARGKSGSEAVEWRQGLATDPPVDEASADAVVISLMLHHLTPPDQRTTLSAARDILKPGGSIHVVEWGIPRGALPRAGFPLLQSIDGKQNTDPFGKGMLAQLLRDAGFAEPQKLHRMGTVWGSVEQYAAERPG